MEYFGGGSDDGARALKNSFIHLSDWPREAIDDTWRKLDFHLVHEKYAYLYSNMTLLAVLSFGSPHRNLAHEIFQGRPAP